MKVLMLVICLAGCASNTARTPDEEYDRVDRAILYQEKYQRYVQGCDMVRGNVRIIRSGRALPRRCLYVACPARVGDTYLCVGR